MAPEHWPASAGLHVRAEVGSSRKGPPNDHHPVGGKEKPSALGQSFQVL